MDKIFIYTDGGSRGNPGPAGIGVVIKFKAQSANVKVKDIEISRYIGIKTNNQAEYMAVIEALKYLNDNYCDKDIEATFFLDSQLVVEQLNQRYKVKNEGLKPLFWQIRDLMMKLGGRITFSSIPREQNKEADRLVNKAIDNHLN